MDDIARATADGMREDAKGAGVDLAVELQCECPPNMCCSLCVNHREREQVPRRVPEDGLDTLAADRETSGYSRVPFQSEGWRRDLCACYASEV